MSLKWTRTWPQFSVYEVKYAIQVTLDSFDENAYNNTRWVDDIPDPDKGLFTTYEVTGLETEKYYVFRVIAKTPYANGWLYSNTIRTKPSLQPLPVQNLHVSMVTLDLVKISWENLLVENTITRVKVTWSGKNSNGVKELDASRGDFNISGLIANEPYAFRVQARNWNALGYEAGVNVTGVPQSTPPPPLNPRLIQFYTDGVELQWEHNPVLPNPVRYQIQCRVEADPGADYRLREMTNCVSGPATLGLKWEEIGSEKPQTGSEIINAALAKALEVQKEFTQEQFDQFQVSDLTESSYIQVDNVYLRPTAGLDEQDLPEKEPGEDIDGVEGKSKEGQGVLQKLAKKAGALQKLAKKAGKKNGGPKTSKAASGDRIDGVEEQSGPQKQDENSESPLQERVRIQKTNKPSILRSAPNLPPLSANHSSGGPDKPSEQSPATRQSGSLSHTGGLSELQKSPFSSSAVTERESTWSEESQHGEHPGDRIISELKVVVNGADLGADACDPATGGSAETNTNGGACEAEVRVCIDQEEVKEFQPLSTCESETAERPDTNKKGDTCQVDILIHTDTQNAAVRAIELLKRRNIEKVLKSLGFDCDIYVTSFPRGQSEFGAHHVPLWYLHPLCASACASVLQSACRRALLFRDKSASNSALPQLQNATAERDINPGISADVVAADQASSRRLLFSQVIMKIQLRQLPSLCIQAHTYMHI